MSTPVGAQAGAGASGAAGDPDRILGLEAERDFLLKSLDDLEVERAAGNVDDADYARLKDDYTARAAAVLRALRDGLDTRPVAPPVPAGRRILVALGILTFAVVAGVLLAGAMGARLPGGTLTGNAQTADPVQAHLAKGSQLVQKQDFVRALQEFGAAYKLDPKNPQAAAYTGWLVFQLRQAGNQEEFVGKAQRLVDEAIAADPSFADAHFFKGMILLQGKNDRAGAEAEFRRFLEIVPSGPEADQVRSLLGQQPGPAPAPSNSTTTRSP